MLRFCSINFQIFKYILNTLSPIHFVKLFTTMTYHSITNIQNKSKASNSITIQNFLTFGLIAQKLEWYIKFYFYIHNHLLNILFVINVKIVETVINRFIFSLSILNQVTYFIYYYFSLFLFSDHFFRFPYIYFGFHFILLKQIYL